MRRLMAIASLSTGSKRIPAALPVSRRGTNGNSASWALNASEDRMLSPFTGYTRNHWIEIAEKLIAGILPYFSPTSGMPELIGVPGESGHFSNFFDSDQQRTAFDRSISGPMMNDCLHFGNVVSMHQPRWADEPEPLLIQEV